MKEMSRAMWITVSQEDISIGWEGAKRVFSRPKRRANIPGSRLNRYQGYQERKSFTCPNTSNEIFVSTLLRRSDHNWIRVRGGRRPDHEGAWRPFEPFWFYSKCDGKSNVSIEAEQGSGLIYAFEISLTQEEWIMKRRGQEEGARGRKTSSKLLH